MAFDAHANFAYSTVLTAPSPATSGTSLVVQSGDGAKFPAVPFNASVWPVGVLPIASNAEIVRVTAVSTDTLTIVRTQESTSARTIVVGDQIAATITKKTFTDIENGDGWSADTNTWKYNTATRFVVPGDATGYLPPGTKISLNDGSVKYAQVTAVLNSAQVGTGVVSTIGSSLFTLNANGFSAFVPLTISGLVLTTGVTNGAVYWPVNVTTNTFQLANVAGGAPITLGGTSDSAIVITTATLVVVGTQSDVTFSNAAFTAPRYSYLEAPQGFPTDYYEIRTGPNAGQVIGTETLTSPNLLGTTTAAALVMTAVAFSLTGVSGVIPITGMLINVTPTSNNITITSTPSITAGTDGQRLIVQNVHATRTFVLQDQGLLTNSGVWLQTGTTREIGPLQSAEFVYNTTNSVWVEQFPAAAMGDTGLVFLSPTLIGSPVINGKVSGTARLTNVGLAHALAMHNFTP